MEQVIVSPISSDCVICGKLCVGGQCLSNGKLYHKKCYEDLLSYINERTNKLSILKTEIEVLKNNYENEASFTKKIMLRLRGKNMILIVYKLRLMKLIMTLFLAMPISWRGTL